MIRLFTLCVAATIALVANQAMAQCVGCASSAPVFNQSQVYSAPVNYGTSVGYSAPVSYVAPASYSTPVYSSGCVSGCGTPVYSAGSCCQTSCCQTACAPVSCCQNSCSQSCCAQAYSAPSCSSCCGTTMMGSPVVYNSGCGSCVSGICGGTVMPQGAVMGGPVVASEPPSATSDAGSTEVVPPPADEVKPPEPDSDGTSDSGDDT